MDLSLFHLKFSEKVLFNITETLIGDWFKFILKGHIIIIIILFTINNAFFCEWFMKELRVVMFI